MWNGKDTAPESIDSDNNIKSIVSRAGIRITLDDTSGAVTLTLKTPGGQSVVLTDGGAQIKVTDLTGNSIQLAPGGITITSAGPLNISAPTASCDFGLLTVDAALTTFSGVVQCDALIAETVIGTTYAPGIGNEV
jgi:phage gp45-like